MSSTPFVPKCPAPSLVGSDILIQLLVAILNFQKSLLAVKELVIPPNLYKLTRSALLN